MRYWNEERIELLKKNYPILKIVEIKNIFPEKNWHCIRAYAYNLGLKRQVECVHYTNEEIKLLRKVYPICSKEDILKLFPNRTWKSIYYLCNDLKIKRKIIANLEIKKFNISDKEKGYIAGMIDGEGCLYFHKKGGSILVTLSISNTNLESLEYIKNVLNCGYITREDRTKENPHYKIAYRFYMNKQGEVLGLLREIEDLIIIKREKYNKFLEIINRWSNRERSNIRHYLIGKEVIPQTRRSEIQDKLNSKLASELK
jgi:hypothetical protein